MVAPAMQMAEKLAGEGISCAVINARFVKPLDEDLLEELRQVLLGRGGNEGAPRAGDRRGAARRDSHFDPTWT